MPRPRNGCATSKIGATERPEFRPHPLGETADGALPRDELARAKKMEVPGKFHLSDARESSRIRVSDRANVARGTISREGVGLGEPIEADGLNREEVVL